MKTIIALVILSLALPALADSHKGTKAAHDKEHQHVKASVKDHEHDEAHHKAHDHKAHHPEHKDKKMKKKKKK